MRKVILCLAALALAGCSQAQLDKVNTTLNKYDQAVQNFNTAAARINISIALTSSTLSGYCDDAKATGQNLTTIVQGNSKAVTALNSLTSGINAYCVSPPQDVGKAVVSLSAIVAAAKQAAKGG